MSDIAALLVFKDTHWAVFNAMCLQGTEHKKKKNNGAGMMGNRSPRSWIRRGLLAGTPVSYVGGPTFDSRALCRGFPQQPKFW